MNNLIGISKVLAGFSDWRIVDVRSPGEFLAGHIPGAINFPLFSDDERERIGTLYKQVSPESAMKEGLKIAGLHLERLMDEASGLFNNKTKQILIHCWRGGKRSEAIHWLINFSGISAFRLEGGYKSYRTTALNFFDNLPFELRILGGYTGSGKTEILKQIALSGQQVIDLESLAHHKGSTFGSIGEDIQPSNEQFENNLFDSFQSFDTTKPVWLENESKSIGRVHIPDGLWSRMKSSILYTIDVDKETRLDRVLAYYSNPIDLDILHLSFDRIHKRLGGLEYQNALNALASGDLRTAASIALVYYDKSYAFQVETWNKDMLIHLADCDGIAETSERLLAYDNIAI